MNSHLCYLLRCKDWNAEAKELIRYRKYNNLCKNTGSPYMVMTTFDFENLQLIKK